jgi:hypothetical protein
VELADAGTGILEGEVLYRLCSHQEAYTEACKLIEVILALIQNLHLQPDHELLAREVVELTLTQKYTTINTLKTLNEIELSRKFSTSCPFVNKTFHIADIMIIEPIDWANSPQPQPLPPDEAFFYYVESLLL